MQNDQVIEMFAFDHYSADLGCRFIKNLQIGGTKLKRKKKYNFARRFHQN